MNFRVKLNVFKKIDWEGQWCYWGWSERCWREVKSLVLTKDYTCYIVTTTHATLYTMIDWALRSNYKLWQEASIYMSLVCLFLQTHLSLLCPKAQPFIGCGTCLNLQLLSQDPLRIRLVSWLIGRLVGCRSFCGQSLSWPIFKHNLCNVKAYYTFKLVQQCHLFLLYVV